MRESTNTRGAGSPADAPSAQPLAKLVPPHLPPVFERRALFEWLDEAVQRGPLIWIEGPAGSGKTMLTMSWARARKLRVLWYQVDAGDRDPASFFHHLGLAVAQAAPRYQTPLPKLTPEYLAGLSVFTRNFFREIVRRLSGAVLLVLDNVQEVGAEAPFYDVLREGLEELPAGTGAVLISRSELPPAFVGWQLSERLSRLDWDALRLNESEAVEFARFLAQRTGQFHESGQVHALHRHCSGWLAGMVLLLQGARAGPGQQGELDMSAPQRLFDYFAGEIFDRRHPAVKEFFMLTALFSSFTDDMAERLTGNSSARSLLRDLIRLHHFIVRRAGSADVYEYHPLFKAFLTERARSVWSASELLRLKHRAARLTEQVGDHDAALTLYLDSGDWDSVIRLILAQAQALAAAGRFETLNAAIGKLPSQVVVEEPWLLYWDGVSRLPFAPQDARSSLERAYAGFTERDDPAGLYLAWAAVVECLFTCWRELEMADSGADDPADHWIAEIQHLRDRHPQFPSTPIEVRVVNAAVGILSLRYLFHPDLPVWLERGEKLMQASSDVEKQSGSEAIQFPFLHYVWSGHADKAEALVFYLRSAADHEAASPVLRIHACSVRALYEGFYGDPAAVLGLVEEGLSYVETLGLFSWKDILCAQDIYAALALGDAARAGHYVGLIEALPKRGIKEAHYHLLAGMTALHRNDLWTAVKHAERGLVLTEPVMPFGYLCFLYLLANTARMRGNTSQALEYVTAARTYAEDKRSKVMVSRCRFTEAAIAFDEGEREAGLRLLREALETSHSLRSPANPWIPHSMLAWLFATALEDGIEVDHVRSLIRRFHIPPPDGEFSLAAWPFPVVIQTFGAFRLAVDERPVTFTGKAQKKPLELLKALIALGSRQVSEDKVAEYLWPDADGAQAMQSLGSTVHRLRKLIGDTALERQQGTLSLNPRVCWVDAWALERQLATVEQSCRDGAPDRVARAVDALFTLYEGSFLEDVPDHHWVLTARERLRARMLRQLGAAADALMQSNRPAEAIACYGRALEIDPLDEACYVGLMRACFSAGRRADALAAYQRCREQLDAAFGITPAPETEALAQRIKSG